MDDEELGELLERAGLLASSERLLKRNELLVALEIEPAVPADAMDNGPTLSIVSSDVITGEDDKPIGAREMHSDNVVRLSLPDPQGWTITQKLEAAEAFIRQIRAHFELDAD